MSSCRSCGDDNAPQARFCAGCGNPLTATQISPTTVGADDRYTLEVKLGEGAMGEVWRAHDTRMDIPVAVKILHANLLSHPTARKRTIDEAKALARVRAKSKNANVIGIYDYFEHDGTVVLVLELVEDGDLADRLEAGTLDWETSIRWMVQILQGLEAIHRANLVHRDLKPGNVLMDGERPLITDLGVVHDAQGRNMTQTGAVLGTPSYMSPEQIRGQKIDARSDLYAAGILLFELLVGAPPFDGASEFDIQKAQTEAEVPLERLPSVIPPEIRAVIARAMSKSPEDRWPSADAMADALSGAMGWATGDFPRVGRPSTRPEALSSPGPSLNPPRSSPPRTNPPRPSMTMQASHAPRTRPTKASSPALSPYIWLSALTAIVIVSVIVYMKIEQGETNREANVAVQRVKAGIETAKTGEEAVQPVKAGIETAKTGEEPEAKTSTSVEKPAAQPKEDPAAQDITLLQQRQDIAFLEQRGKAQITGRRWDQALITWQRILEIDPLHTNARKALNQVPLWKQDDETLKKARAARKLKQYEKAERLLLKFTDLTSPYFNDAKEELALLREEQPKLVMKPEKSEKSEKSKFSF